MPGLSETITVRSIVGRFLEHSRIFRFGTPTAQVQAHRMLHDPVGDPGGGTRHDADDGGFPAATDRDGSEWPDGVAAPAEVAEHPVASEVPPGVHAGPPRPPHGSGPARYFIGSADLMERNLDRRIEALVPVRDPELRARLEDMLALNLADDTNSWALGPDGNWATGPDQVGLLHSASPAGPRRSSARGAAVRPNPWSDRARADRRPRPRQQLVPPARRRGEARRQLRAARRAKEMLRLGDLVARDRRASASRGRRGAAIEVIRRFKAIADVQRVDEIVALGTAAIREALDGGVFVDQVRTETGVEIEVVDGIREAQLIFTAIRSSVLIDPGPALAADLGGGSLELMVGDRTGLSFAASVQLGVGRLTAELVASDPPSEKDRERLHQRSPRSSRRCSRRSPTSSRSC